MNTPMRKLKSFALAVLFAAAVFALAFTSFRPFFDSSSVARGSSKAPVWEFKDPDGKLVRSSEFDGQVVILNFWATWCPPCRAEIPGFIELQSKYGAQGLAVVGISLDENRPSVVKQFMERLGINYPVVMGNINMMEKLGGTAIPTSFVIDRSGNIVGRHVGFASKETFEKEIIPLL